MGEAFDTVREALGANATPPLTCEGAACRVIEAARSGERDPARLLEAGLGWGGRTRNVA
jgi:hypothetical protein